MSTNTRLECLAVTRPDLCVFALANAAFYALLAEFFVAALQVAMEMFLYSVSRLPHRRYRHSQRAE